MGLIVYIHSLYFNIQNILRLLLSFIQILGQSEIYLLWGKVKLTKTLFLKGTHYLLHSFTNSYFGIPYRICPNYLVIYISQMLK